MKFLIVAKNKRTYFIERLTKEVSEDDLILWNPYSEASPIFSPSTIVVRTTGVYGDNTDLEKLTQWQSANIINPVLALRLFRSKIDLYKFLDQNNFDLLPWLDLLSSSSNDLESFLGQNPSQAYLIKPHRGQGGWGIKTFYPAELLDWFSKQIDREYIVQPFQQDVHELRFFFIQDWVITMKRIKFEGEVSANFQTLGKAEVVETPPLVTEVLFKLRQSVPLHYGAIDAFVIDGRLHILDINMSPGIEQLEQVSGINIMKRFVNSLG